MTNIDNLSNESNEINEPTEEPTQHHDPVSESQEPAEAATVQNAPRVPDAVGTPIAFDSTSRTPPNPRILIFAGCGVLALIAVVGVIVLVASLLGGGGWKKLTADAPSTTHPDGISVALAGEGNLRVRLNSVPRELFLSGEAGDDYKDAVSSIPSYLEMKSPLYLLDLDGETGAVTEIMIPNDSQPYETLSLYRWDDESKRWLFVPNHIDGDAQVIRTDARADNVAVFQTKPVTPLITTTLESNQVFTQEAASTVNMVFPTGLTLDSESKLTGSLMGGWELGKGYAVVPVIRADGALVTGLLNNPSLCALHINDIRSFLIGYGYNGIGIDYSSISPDDREVFATFIEELGADMQANSKLLVVFLPAPLSTPDGYETGSYDWRAIGAASDAVVVNTGLDPQTFVQNGEATKLIGWAVGEVDRLKLHVAFTSLSIKATGGSLGKLTYDAALEPLGGVTAITAPNGDLFPVGSPIGFDLNGGVTDFRFDEVTGDYLYRTSSGDQIELVTADSIRRRLNNLSMYHIGGMLIHDMLDGGNDAHLLTAVNQFKTNTESSVPNQLLMKWTINGASGAVFEQNTGIGTPLVWQPESGGDYTVQGNLVGGRISDRGAVSVRVGEQATAVPPTPTPTTAPVTNNNNNSTPVPGKTNTPAPPKPTSSGPPPSGGGAGNPGGSLELGGQVPGSLGVAPYLQQAGMNWVKFQAKWPYVDAGVAGSYVNAAHSAGYKVLLSIPGPLYPGSIDFNAYTQHLAAVASYKPDAIEIWNEMNLDREWPAGQIDPTSYVNNMLAPGFNAIKAASPGTIVIIGALAPTGFDNTTNAWSDQRYLQGLNAAGAANYANCVGAHHNSGTTSPSVRSGRGEGNHYSWYYLPTLEVTYNAMGGKLPVCVTEFGYLTPEGYGPLPSAFAWGADNTVGEQAAWLKEGVDLARGLSWVRLVIIWNVGFTEYASDPQAGYSIIRPDGTCPACDTLP